MDKATAIDQARIQVVRESFRLFSEWFRGIAPQQRPAVLITLAGYRKQAEQEPEPMIYLLNSQTNFAPQLFKETCLSGVPQYAVYLVHRYYDSSISLDKANGSGFASRNI